MNEVKTIFQQRVAEIETYFSFISIHTNTTNNEDLNRILKANLLLMLYNLVESSISNAVEEIHNEIHLRTVSFNSLKIQLRTKLITYLNKNLNASNFVSTVNDLALDIVKQCFDKQKLFNGNVDSRKIRELGENYGFRHTTDYEKTKNGVCLVTIKGKRNDLAHGTFSFTEVGKEYSIGDLEKMKSETTFYLEEIISNIEDYLNTQEYKQLVTVA